MINFRTYQLINLASVVLCCMLAFVASNVKAMLIVQSKKGEVGDINIRVYSDQLKSNAIVIKAK